MIILHFLILEGNEIHEYKRWKALRFPHLFPAGKHIHTYSEMEWDRYEALSLGDHLKQMSIIIAKQYLYIYAIFLSRKLKPSHFIQSLAKKSLVQTDISTLSD